MKKKQQKKIVAPPKAKEKEEKKKQTFTKETDPEKTMEIDIWPYSQ